ncbi:MAG: type II secretion system protein GspM [Pseudomonadota bacterium]
MRDWFDNLDAREKLFVSVGAVIVLVSVVWGLVWVPLDRGHENRMNAVSTWERSLTELAPLKARATAGGTSQGSQTRTSSQTPVVIIDQTLRARGLDRALKRSQPTTSTGIRVEFENVAFDDLVVWLGDLSAQYGMDVQQGSFSSTARSAPGRVNASMTLERRL